MAPVTPFTVLQASALGLFLAAVVIGATVYSVTQTSPGPGPTQPPNQTSNQPPNQGSTPDVTDSSPPRPPGSLTSPTQSVSSATPPPYSPFLSLPILPSNRPFKVLILADLHFGEAQDLWWGPAQDVNSTRVIESVLTAESPDFVVLLGDLVTGEDLVNATNATAYVDRLLEPIVTRGTPFASTYGNHDISENLPRERLYMHEKQYSLSYTQRSDPLTVTGVTNYALQFRSVESESTQGARTRQPPAFQFVFLDSNGVTGLVNKTGVPDVDWVTESQVTLLRDALLADPTSGTDNSTNSTVPAYVFVHIPSPQFNTLQAGSPQCVGLHDETDIGVQKQDRGLWDALYSSANAVAVFSGHDHGSGWCCPTGRVPAFTACFARHSGYGGYGSWARGARVVLIDEKDPGKLETWVRMEDGSVVDHFVQGR